MKKFVLFVFVILFLATPSWANGSNGEGSPFIPIVPCGPGMEEHGGDEQCEIWHLGRLIWNVMGFTLTWIVPPLATVLFLWGGFRYYLSGGNPEHVKEGTRIMTVTIVGLVIVYLSFVVLSSFLSFLGVEGVWPLIDNGIPGFPD